MWMMLPHSIDYTLSKLTSVKYNRVTQGYTIALVTLTYSLKVALSCLKFLVVRTTLKRDSSVPHFFSPAYIKQNQCVKTGKGRHSNDSRENSVVFAPGIDHWPPLLPLLYRRCWSHHDYPKTNVLLVIVHSGFVRYSIPPSYNLTV